MKTCNLCSKFKEDKIFFRNGKHSKMCTPCADLQNIYQRIHWPNTMIKRSKHSDKKYNRPWEDGEFVTAKFLLNQYQEQEGYCFYYHDDGPLKMQMLDRRADDGLTIERLDNNFPHTRDNCVLACFECNVKKRVQFKEPLHLC